MNDIILVFTSALISATVMPGASEVVLTASVIKQPDNVWWLWLAASTGNTLGALITWLMGKYLLHFQHSKWFPFRENKLARAQAWFQKYGYWSLLLSWMPVIGDALPFIAGVMRVKFPVVLLLVFIGKAARYAVIIYLAQATLL